MALEKKVIFKYDKNERNILIEEKTDNTTEKREYVYNDLGNLSSENTH